MAHPPETAVARCRAQLRSGLPLIAEWLQKRAVKQLISLKTPAAIRELAEFAGSHSRSAAQAQAREALRKLSEPQLVDALCEIWSRDFNEVLGVIIRERAFIATSPGRVRALTLLFLDQREKLARESAGIVEPLFDLASSGPEPFRAKAAASLAGLKEQSAINKVSEIWSEKRDPFLEEAIVAGKYQATYPPKARVLSVLKTQECELICEDGPRVAEFLAAALQDPDVVIAKQAAQAVKLMKRADTRDLLCTLALQPEQSHLRELVLEAKFAPQEPSQRAVFFFLTEQWDRYESLDFDQSLLGMAYELGDPVMRSRLATKARRAGRTEWVSIVSQQRLEKKLGELNEVEWEAALAVLEENQRWEEMWRLGQVAPPAWGARFLSRLDQAGWLPAGSETEKFKQMFESARKAVETTGQGAGLDSLLGEQLALKGHEEHINALGFSKNGVLATIGNDRTIRLWDLPKREQVRVIDAHEEWISCLAWHPEENILATGSRDKTVRLWNAASGQLVRRLDGHNDEIRSIGFSRDGEWVVSVSADHTARIWPWRRGEEPTVLNAHTDMVSCFAFNRENELLATGSYDNSVRVWKFPSGEPVQHLTGHKGLVNCVAFTDAGLLLSGSKDRSVMAWQLPSGGQLRRLKGHGDDVVCLAVSPDGKVLASGSWDSTIRLWHLPGGEPAAILGSAQTMDGHTSWVLSLEFSPDGRILVSAGADGTIRLWDVQAARQFAVLEGHEERITGVASTPDQQGLASCGWDGTVRLWRSELERVKTTPLRQTTVRDLEWVRNSLKSPRLSEREAKWLQFLSLIMTWQRRHDIEVVDQIPIAVGEFDIEIEVAAT